MKEILFKGCGTAIATPFTDDGVNLKEFKRLIEFQIEKGVDSIIVCGTTGESATMSEDERNLVIKCAIETSSGRVPIIVGTGSNDTAHAISMSKTAEALGADGLLVVTPYYNKTTQAGLVTHFTAIANSVSIPIILYSVSSRTGVNIEPLTCLELSKVPNIVAIKEASGNLSQVAKIAGLCKDNLHIYSGNDDQVLPILSLGGLGVISVVSNIMPDTVHKMVYDFLEGDVASATATQLKLIPLIDSLFSEVNPIPVKEALNIFGFDFGVPRLPLVPMSVAKREVLLHNMEDLNLI